MFTVLPTIASVGMTAATTHPLVKVQTFMDQHVLINPDLSSFQAECSGKHVDVFRRTCLIVLRGWTTMNQRTLFIATLVEQRSVVISLMYPQRSRH